MTCVSRITPACNLSTSGIWTCRLAGWSMFRRWSSSFAIEMSLTVSTSVFDSVISLRMLPVLWTRGRKAIWFFQYLSSVSYKPFGSSLLEIGQSSSVSASIVQITGAVERLGSAVLLVGIVNPTELCEFKSDAEMSDHAEVCMCFVSLWIWLFRN